MGDQNSLCQNTSGAYSCSCSSGYNFLEGTCKNIDECSANENPCKNHGDNLAECTDTVGSYTCKCSSGFSFTEGSCTTSSTAPCEANPCRSNGDLEATCVENQSVYSCNCSEGFHFDNTSCLPTCGDGKIVSGENCDDGNQQADDGCSSSCTVESNYECKSLPSICVSGNILFFDNFEDQTISATKWFGNLSYDKWEIGIPTGNAFNSENNGVLATNLDGNYSNNSDISVRTSDISIAGQQDIYIQFDAYVHTEIYNNQFIDGTEIHTVNLSNRLIDRINLVDKSDTELFGNFTSGENGVSGQSKPYTYSRFGGFISSKTLAEDKFRLRFYFISDASVTSEGIYIDNVFVHTPEIINITQNGTVQLKKDEWDYYVFMAASGTFTASIESTSVDGSVKMYVKKGNAPTASSHDCTESLYAPGKVTCTVDGPGKIFLGIVATGNNSTDVNVNFRGIRE